MRAEHSYPLTGNGMDVGSTGHLENDVLVTNGARDDLFKDIPVEAVEELMNRRKVVA